MRTPLLCSALLAAGLVAAPTTAPAAPAPVDPGPHLSSRLETYVDALADGLGARATARAMSLAPSGPGSLLTTADGSRLVVTVRFAAYGEAEVAAVGAAGGELLNRNPAFSRVTVAVRPDDLSAVGAVPGVEYVGEQRTPTFNAVCDTTVSEGDALSKAASVRATRGVDGTGIRVGVLSDTYDKVTTPTSAATDVTADNLPGTTNTCGHTAPVGVVGTQPATGTDEGRAMAQVVHDLAPGAAIDFASAFVSEDQFAANIDSLVDRGDRVIVDDVTYPDEPMYQDGIIEQAVTRARATGVDYFSSAGNESLADAAGHQVGSYEAVAGYRPTTCPAAVTAVRSEADCHNFGTTAAPDATYGFTPGASPWSLSPVVDWAEPWGGVTTDLDVFLLKGTTVVASSTDDNTGLVGSSQMAYEGFDYAPSGTATGAYSIVVARRSSVPPASTPRFKMLYFSSGQPFATVEHPTATGTDVMGPTIFGHNGGADAVSVGASAVTNPGTLDAYSSYGPVTTLFGPVRADGLPAAALASPVVLAKPDVVASDCARNSFFGDQAAGGLYRFCGTSQAAPHAAAVAALLRQLQPAASPAQVNAAVAATATPIAGVPASFQGAGLVNALAASTLLVPPVVAPAPTPLPTPDTALTKAPGKRVSTTKRRSKQTFAFTSTVAGATFTCSVDGKPYAPCAPTTKLKVKAGKHTFAVRATANGVTDPSPASVTWKVVRRTPRPKR